MSGLGYMLTVCQPWVTRDLHIVYRWFRADVGQRGRYLVGGIVQAHFAVVDDFGNLVRVPS